MRKSLQCKIGCKKLDFNLQSQYCPTCLTQQADRGCAVTTCQMDYCWWYSVSTKQRCEDVLYQQFHKPLVSRQRISPRRLHLCVIQSRILILDYTKWLHSPTTNTELGLGTLPDHINSLDTSYCILDICRTNNNVKTIKCLRCSNSMNITKIDQHFNWLKKLCLKPHVHHVDRDEDALTENIYIFIFLHTYNFLTASRLL